MHEAHETKVGRSLVRADSNEDVVKVFEHVAIHAKACADAGRIKIVFQATLTHLNSGLSAGTAQVLQM